MTEEAQKKANLRLARKLGLAVAGMFGFAFSLVPLYNVFCDITGLNGKTGRVAETRIEIDAKDLSRTITVEFTANVGQGLPWSFKPLTHKMDVHPGVIEGVSYVARNLIDEAVTGRAIPSLTPGPASRYFNKTECFCFSRQTLQPGETMEMPVRFIIDPNLPPDVRTVTLSYTFFKVKKTGKVKKRAKNKLSSKDTI